MAKKNPYLLPGLAIYSGTIDNGATVDYRAWTPGSMFASLKRTVGLGRE